MLWLKVFFFYCEKVTEQKMRGKRDNMKVKLVTHIYCNYTQFSLIMSICHYLNALQKTRIQLKMGGTRKNFNTGAVPISCVKAV